MFVSLQFLVLCKHFKSYFSASFILWPLPTPPSNIITTLFNSWKWGFRLVCKQRKDGVKASRRRICYISIVEMGDKGLEDCWTQANTRVYWLAATSWGCLHKGPGWAILAESRVRSYHTPIAKDCSSYKGPCNFSKGLLVINKRRRKFKAKISKWTALYAFMPWSCFTQIFAKIFQLLSSDRPPEAQTLTESERRKPVRLCAGNANAKVFLLEPVPLIGHSGEDPIMNSFRLGLLGKDLVSLAA